MVHDSEVNIEAEQLLALQAGSGVSKQAMQRAFQLAFPPPDSHEWRILLMRLFYSVGGALFVCGLYFLVDHFWEVMNYFSRCGFLGLSTLLCAALAFRRGAKSIAGKVSLTCASALLGGFLIVLLKVQETGNWDQVLSLWSFLIVPWCIMAEFAPLWLLATTLFNITLYVVCLQNFDWWIFEDYYFQVLLVVLNAALLGSWEVGFRRGKRWAGRRWFPPILTLYGLLPLTLAACTLVLDETFIKLFYPVGVSLAACWAGFLSYFSAIRRDVSVLALTLGSMVMVGTSCLWLMLSRSAEIEVLLLLSLGILIQVSGALGLLRKLAPPLKVGESPQDRSVAIKRWLGKLATEGLIETEKLEGLSKSIQLQGENALPWFVRALAAFASFAASVLLLFYLIVTGWVTEENGILVGLALCVLACVMSRVKSDLLLQSALSFSFCGQILMLIFLSYQGYSIETVLLSMAALEVSLVAFFPGAFGRFLSVNLAGLFFAGWLSLVSNQAGYDLFAVAIAGLVAFLWLKQGEILVGPLGPILAPLGLGSTSLLFILLYSTVSRSNTQPIVGLISAVGLTALTVFVAQYLGAPQKALVGILLVGIVSWSAPGVIAAVLVLLLSFYRRNQTLQGFAVIFLVFFGTSYYYQLNLDLLTKSIVLLASGLIFSFTARTLETTDAQ